MSKETNWISLVVAAILGFPMVVFAVAGHWVDLGIWTMFIFIYVVLNFLSYLKLLTHYEGELRWQRDENGQMQDSSEARNKRISALPGFYLAYFGVRDLIHALRSS